MFNTSIGSFLSGVVTALKVTLSLVQVWRTKTASCPLTDSCPKAVDIRGKLQMCSFTSLSHMVLMEISDCKPVAIKFCDFLFLIPEHSFCTYNKMAFTYVQRLNILFEVFVDGKINTEVACLIYDVPKKCSTFSYCASNLNW